MTDGADDRLLLHLEVLRIALAAYLTRLQRLWTGAAERPDVERLLLAAGTAAEPSHGERETVRELLGALARAGGPLARVSEALALTTVDEIAVAAAWWADADPQFAAVLGCAHDDGGRRYVSPTILRLLLEPFGLRFRPALAADDPLVRNGVVAAGAEAGAPLSLTPTAQLLLAGIDPEPAHDGADLPERLRPQVEPLRRHLDEHPAGIVLIRGPRGTGRLALAAAAVRASGRVPVDGGRPAPELRLLARVGAAVPLVAVDAVAALDWGAHDPSLLAWGGVHDAVRGAYVVEIAPPSRAERIAAWRGALADLGVDPATAPVLATRFRFTEGDVGEVVRRVRADAAWEGRPVDAALVWDAARRQPEHELARLAALVTPAFTLDDLVLTERARAQLEELIAHVALQHVVLDDWGFRRRLPRGQGVAALFAGPPGTGKTTAAEAIADALRQDLYRIDLSAVVSKYVGETEKNLASAFDEAERAGAVLFFDEADALFGRRTEVRDAHDRYANLEVNYLLQRVETFTGLVVLATNRESAVDEAFVRRLRFIVRFEAPGPALRRELWRRAFPPEAGELDLDWDALAECELAGGPIQSAALSAAYAAAAEPAGISMPHVEHALDREYEKLGRAWPGLRRTAEAAA